MTLLVRNEADVIEANLDYHLAQGVDFVLVTDHDSRDDTRARLVPYEQAGVLAVIHASEDAHHQSQRVTRMAALAYAEHGADWVIHNDADEFWWPVAGRLRDVFAAIPDAYGQVVVPRRNFPPVPEDSEPFYSRLIYREAESSNLFGGALEPKVAHRARSDIVVAPGNHSVSGPDLRPAPVAGLLEIFHFPMRGYEQFECKVIQTGRGYELLEDRSPGIGRDQLLLLEMYREGGLRRHWEAAILDAPALARGLADGTIVLDRRLDDFMRRRARGAQAYAAADSSATRSTVATLMQAVLERDDGRHALLETESELALVRAERAALAQTLDETQVALAEIRSELAVSGELLTGVRSELAVSGELLNGVRSELAATTELLSAVRSSRLLRWSRPMRRGWYRARALTLRAASRGG